MKGPQNLPRALLKAQARRLLFGRTRLCMAASAAFLALQTAALYFQMNNGGVFGYYVLRADEYTTATGIWLAEGGLTAVFRLDSAGVLFALPMSFRQIGFFVLVNSLVFIVTIPLLMGVLEHYYAAVRNLERPFSSLFRWYLDLRLTLKALALGFVLALVKWGSRFLCAAPAVAVFVWATGSPGLDATLSSALAGLSFLLFLAGWIGSYCVYTLVLPAQYLLIREPDASVGRLLTSGVRVFRGRRLDYLLFRLSFLLWHVAVSMSYGIMGLLVQPYFELSNLLYLQSAAPPENGAPPPAQT